MKKLRIALLCVFSALLFCVVFKPISAEAATTRTLKNGYTYSLTLEGKYYYKMILEEDSMVQYTYTGNTAQRMNLCIYKDSKRKSIIYSYSPSAKSGSKYYALKKGTYYIDMHDGYSFLSDYTPTTKATVTVTPAKSLDKQNYCRAKAQVVKSNSTVKVAQTPSYDYVRWYKFTLAKAQKVTLITPNGFGSYLDIYSPTLQLYDVEYTSSQSVTRDKLAAGTYFIRVSANGNSYTNDRGGAAILFKWK